MTALAAAALAAASLALATGAPLGAPGGIAPAWASPESSRAWLSPPSSGFRRWTCSPIVSGPRAARTGASSSYWSVHPLALVDLLVPRLVADLPMSDGRVGRPLRGSRSRFLARLYLGRCPRPWCSSPSPARRPAPRWAVIAGSLPSSSWSPRWAVTPVYPAAARAPARFSWFRYPVKYTVPARPLLGAAGRPGPRRLERRLRRRAPAGGVDAWPRGPGRGPGRAGRRANGLRLHARELAGAGSLAPPEWWPSAYARSRSPVAARLCSRCSPRSPWPGGPRAAKTASRRGPRGRGGRRSRERRARRQCPGSRGSFRYAAPRSRRPHRRPPEPDAGCTPTSTPVDLAQRALLRGPAGGTAGVELGPGRCRTCSDASDGARWRIAGSYDGDFTGLALARAVRRSRPSSARPSTPPAASRAPADGGRHGRRSRSERLLPGLRRGPRCRPSSRCRCACSRVPDPLPRAYVVGGAAAATATGDAGQRGAIRGSTCAARSSCPRRRPGRGGRRAELPGRRHRRGRRGDRCDRRRGRAEPPGLAGGRRGLRARLARAGGRASRSRCWRANALFRAVAVPAGDHGSRCATGRRACRRAVRAAAALAAVTVAGRAGA